MAYLFSPLVDNFAEVGLPRWLSISLVFIGIGIALTLAVWYMHSFGLEAVDDCA